jgi:hypothetical protein
MKFEKSENQSVSDSKLDNLEKGILENFCFGPNLSPKKTIP